MYYSFVDLKTKKTHFFLKLKIYFLISFFGLLFGSITNMSIIKIGNSMITLPDGAYNSSIQGIKNTIHLFQFKHFNTPI